MIESHLLYQGYNTALSVSGIKMISKQEEIFFRWNGRCCGLASENYVAQSFDGEIATDEL